MKEKVYEIVSKIPIGKVMTYSDIAILIGNKNLSRVVGNLLHVNPNNKIVPCHRVVNINGELAKSYGLGGIEVQKKMLELEGIEVINYKVDLKKYRL